MANWQQHVIKKHRPAKCNILELIKSVRGHDFDHIVYIFLVLQVSASKVLQETCNYIRSLHREVDDLSDRLSELLEATDSDSAQAAIIRSLLM